MFRTAHCLFEQSGTFKNAFLRNGINAIDYDIAETANVDVITDLFVEIENCFYGLESNSYYGMEENIFNHITKDDLIIAFFPCTYFCGFNQIEFRGISHEFTKHKTNNNTREIIKRARNRSFYYVKLLQLITIAKERGLKLIVENPATNSYLKNNLPYDFLLLDKNRQTNGDYFKKPTYYFFYNLKPNSTTEYLQLKLFEEKERKIVYKLNGIARSLISPDYADNFIKTLLI